MIPELTISSDFISGFCTETLEEHLETISLLKEVKYEQAFMVCVYASLLLIFS
jgi:tRNA A37 methylthiotransferase MiaB